MSKNIVIIAKTFLGDDMSTVLNKDINSYGLDKKLDHYNWNNGFGLPSQVIDPRTVNLVQR